jgi:hypothetical protein
MNPYLESIESTVPSSSFLGRLQQLTLPRLLWSSRMREDPPVLESISEELQTALKWVATGVIEALFVSSWVIIQWSVNEYVIARYVMVDVDAWTLTVAQRVFAIATLVPIVFRLIRLFGTMAIRTYRALRKEWREPL